MGHIANGSVYSLDDAPLLVSKESDFAKSVYPVKNTAFKFTAPDIIWQEKYKNLQLVPFYTIHDARYVIYWPTTTPEKLPELQKSIKEKEDARLKLELATIDMVTPGEQQPESDHQFKGEKTETGIYRERHFRYGEGFFSYNLRNLELQAKSLSFTYYGADKNRNFNVYVNDVLVTSVKLDGSEGDHFIEKIVKLPASVLDQKPEKLNVKFQAQEGSSITGIYEVRLLK